MTSLFYTTPCEFDDNARVTQVAWSNVEPIAALACNVDDRQRKLGQILFVNNEVSLFTVYFKLLIILYL
jgi:hypothetical protein